MPTNQYDAYRAMMPRNLQDMINSNFAPSDPTYQYTHGSRSLPGDVTQLRSRLASGVNPRSELGTYTTAHTPGHTALWQRILNSDTRDLRKAYGYTALLSGLGFAGAAAGGAGAAGAAGGVGGAGAGTAGAGAAAGSAGAGTTAGIAAGAMGAGAGAGAGAAAAGAGGGGSGALWASLGSQALGGYLNKRASDKARNQQQQNIQNALAQLTPEAIQRLIQMFYAQNYATMMPQMQGAQNAISGSAARSGLTGAGVVQQLRAGIPGQFAQSALNTSTNQALGVAGQRASTLAGAPVSAPYSFGNDLNDLMETLGRYGLLRNRQQQTQQPSNANQWWIEGPGHSNVWT